MALHVVGEKYAVLRKVGKGSFGEVFLGKDIYTGQEVAIKLESINKTKNQRLKLERKFYEIIHGELGFPHVMWSGSQIGYNILIMELLGPSLEDLFEYCSHSFTLKTVLMLADQMLARLQYIHSKNIVHRDIKPDNFLMGVGAYVNTVYLVDFGLANDYLPNHGEPGPSTRYQGLVGTARYASWNAHQGNPQSPKDDLEALWYTILYFLRGVLPWQNIKAVNYKQKHEKIAELKKNIPIDDLCENLPSEFPKVLHYSRNLEFGEMPNYYKIRRMFHNLFNRQNYDNDQRYDWMK